MAAVEECKITVILDKDAFTAALHNVTQAVQPILPLSLHPPNKTINRVFLLTCSRDGDGSGLDASGQSWRGGVCQCGGFYGNKHSITRVKRWLCETILRR